MGMLQGSQGFFQVAAPHVSAVDHAQGQHLVRWQAVEDGRVLVRRTHQVDMQAIHRKVGSQAKVFFQAAEVSGHQFFQRVALDQVIGALKSVLPVLGQIERQDWLVDLHPLNAQFGQALEYLAIQRQQSLEQVELVEVSALGLAQPQIGQRADHHGLDAVPQVEGFLDLFEELVPRQVELLIDAELRHQVVIVGVEPLGHLLGMGTAAAAVTDATGHGEQGMQRGLAIRRAEPLRDHTEHQRMGQHLVVPGEITDRQQVDTGLLLQRPVGAAQITANGAQAGFVELTLPERFLRFFQFTIASNAWKPEGMSDCHDLQLRWCD